jgi:hypothetical protein
VGKLVGKVLDLFRRGVGCYPVITMRDNRLARFCEWLRHAPILAGLWLLDRIVGPYPETKADRIRERRRARLRRAFPGMDIDGTGTP